MQENRRWINQYVSLANTLPELLLSCASRIPSPEEAAAAQERIPHGRPLFVEFGSGSGHHLLNRAAQRPDAFFVGFELRYKRAFRTAEKAKERGLTNLFIIRDDLANCSSYFKPLSVDCIFINFPDPWDRKKWKKHRMISETTLPIFHALLKPDALIRYKTDHQGYFHDSLALVSQSSFFSTVRSTTDMHRNDFCPDNVLTEFEQLFISKKMPIYYAEFAKVHL